MSEKDHITGRQIAAARTLAGISQAVLAGMANVSIPTLRRMEASHRAAAGMTNNVAAVRRALEDVGCSFLADDGAGPGVRAKGPFGA